MKKELPIVIEGNKIVSECWTFAKMAIIQTSKYANDWLSCHLNLYMDAIGNPFFGEHTNRYSASYYEDILESHITNIYSISKDEIINFLKMKINAQEYILLQTNWNMNVEDTPSFHEVLIYGYDDDRKVFLSPMIRNKIFTACEIPYQHIEKFHPLMIDYFSHATVGRLWFSIHYQYPLITYSLKNTYTTDQCVYMAVNKIDQEMWGKQVTASVIGDMDVYDAPVYYTGIGCLCGLEKTIVSFIKQRPMAKDYIGLPNTFKKMSEHRFLLLHAMRYIQNKWDVSCPQTMQSIQDYSLCCERFLQWQRMAVKYYLRTDDTILYRILKDLRTEFLSERDALHMFQKSVADWYQMNNKA